MKITLYIAVSIDWYIAKKNGDSNFVSQYDIPIFEKYINLSDAIIVWGTTFHQYFSEIYPIKWKANIVFWKNKENTSIENTHFFF